MDSRYFVANVLEADLSADRLLQLDGVEGVEQLDDEVLLTIRLCRRVGHKTLRRQPADERAYVRVRCYGEQIVRMQVAPDRRPFVDDSPMLEWDGALRAAPIQAAQTGSVWRVSAGDKIGLTVDEGAFAPAIALGNGAAIQFQNEDHFEEPIRDALPAFFLRRASGAPLAGFAVKIAPDERFCGTGERFDRLDLFGRQIDLVNDDARGTNSARAYKNVPFCMSSRRYAVFVHSSAKMRLDIGCHSKRSLQWLVADDSADIFFIGGADLAEVLYHYRRITGFPRMPPVWSFGVWMSRMTYRSDRQVSEVARRLRDEQYPMDVLHLDTGWFTEDWKCDWRFSATHFPDPPDFFRRMRAQGFRVSLWQYPYINRDIDLFPLALEKGYIGTPAPDRSDHSGGDSAGSQSWGDTLDFTNPDAVTWYMGLLRAVLSQGAAAIKADFGENINEHATYRQIDPALYRNLFALLYQRIVWEVTQDTTGDPLIWARAAWAGSQRYPVHWGGDAACTFEGLSASIWGGLHLGLSGFAFWSHDVGGFHGVPGFLSDKPSETLYARWVQVGAFTSHMRFHGTTPREPWEYPGVAGIVRQWLRLRYALLPYILREAEACCRNGMPMLRALVLHAADDLTAWHVPDEYFFGESFLVCPILNPGDRRDVYLPGGRWVDFWSGAEVNGPVWLKDVTSPLSRMPLYVAYGARIPFAEPAQHTGELSKAARFDVAFDNTYAGFEASELARHIDL